MGEIPPKDVDELRIVIEVKPDSKTTLYGVGKVLLDRLLRCLEKIKSKLRRS